MFRAKPVRNKLSPCRFRPTFPARQIHKHFVKFWSIRALQDFAKLQVSKMTATANGLDAGKKQQKRKREETAEDPGDTGDLGDAAQSKTSKRERRAAKKLKKLEEDDGHSKIPNGLPDIANGTKGPDSKPNDLVSSEPSKKERRAARKLKKLEEADGHGKDTDGLADKNNGINESALKSSVLVSSKHSKKEKRKATRSRQSADQDELPAKVTPAIEGPDLETGDIAASKSTKKERRKERKATKLENEKRPIEENVEESDHSITLATKDENIKSEDNAPESTIIKEDVEKTKKSKNKSVNGQKRQEYGEKSRSKAAKEEGTAEKPKKNGSKGADKSTIGNGEVKSEEPAAILSSKATYQEAPSLTALPQSEVDAFLTSNFITIKDPSASTPLRPIINFSHLPKTATPSGKPFAAFQSPTPIQSAAWPFLLSGRDVIGVAETGSGKTLAFGVPCIRFIATSAAVPKGSSPAKAVIVSPTRELAVQIHTQIETLATPASLSTVCVYGGVPKDQQRAALKTAHIVVATPGRLNDLIEEGAADLSNVTYCVLDEADRMLDKGFEAEIRKIISTTSKNGRQTLMFTATWPPSVRDLAATFMTQPVHISIGEDNPTGELRANTKIKQIVEVIDPYGKEQRLLQILKQHQGPANKKDRILVFCLYKKEASRIEGFLRQRGLKVAGIHGDMGQSARQISLDNFKSGSCPLLVATDVAARGLDIPAVKVVFNVTFPLTVEDYVHRIGRTGRAGAEGLAITLFTDHDKARAGELINVLRAANQEIPADLLKFGTTVKKKGHEAYGAFYKDTGGEMKKSTKIKFED